MKLKISLMVSLGVTAWLSVMWAAIFWMMLHHGQVFLYEPDKVVLIIELVVAVGLVIGSMACFYNIVRSLLKRKEESWKQ